MPKPKTYAMLMQVTEENGNIPVCSPLSGKHSHVNVVDVVVPADPRCGGDPRRLQKPRGPCRPMMGLRPHRNIVGEYMRDMASTMKEYRKCSTSWDYTHTMYLTFPPGSEPGEQRKEDEFGSRFQQHDDVRMVDKSPT